MEISEMITSRRSFTAGLTALLAGSAAEPSQAIAKVTDDLPIPATTFVNSKQGFAIHDGVVSIGKGANIYKYAIQKDGTYLLLECA